MDAIRSERIREYIAQFPALLTILERLAGAEIPHLIGGSGCLFLHGNDRAPDDVDVYLPDEAHDAADQLFGVQSFTYTSSLEHVRNSNPDGTHTYQLTSALRISAEGTTYPLSMGPEVFRQGVVAGPLRLLPVEDVLLIKALLRRSADVGKHDLEDIAAFLRVHPRIDHAYLETRIAALGATMRVGDTFLTANS